MVWAEGWILLEIKIGENPRSQNRFSKTRRDAADGAKIILSSFGQPVESTVCRLTCMSLWTNNGTRASKVLRVNLVNVVNMQICECVNVVNIVNFLNTVKITRKFRILWI